jgi:hypothetical protein
MSKIMQPIDLLPSLDDLKKLPLRAIVAIAARAALRINSAYILPQVHPIDPTLKEALIQTITVAESFAASSLTHELYKEASISSVGAKKAADAATVSNWLPAQMTASSAFFAGRAVVAATSSFADMNEIVMSVLNNPSLQNPESETKLAGANYTVDYALQALHCSIKGFPVSAKPISDDYRFLISLNLGSFPDSGNPIDSREQGPLGSLWPEGSPKWYVPDTTHLFFAELLQFVVSMATMQSLLLSSQLHKAYTDENNVRIETPEGQAIMAVVPDLRMPLTMIEEDCDEYCSIDSSGTVEYLIGNTPPPAQLYFAMTPFTKKMFPKLEGVQAQVSNHMGASAEVLICYLIGGAFERSIDQFEKNYGTDRKKWPPELQFFRHLRNGCFHGNRFNITPTKSGQTQIDASRPPHWHTYIMSSDAAMDGLKVIDGWFHIPHVLPFLNDMGKYI